jgi:hypothetical protein
MTKLQDRDRFPWKHDNCDQVLSYSSIYPVPTAAALWCRIPQNEIQQYFADSYEVHRGIYRHPYIPCLEARCRAMHEAIERGDLPVSRETGRSFDGSRQIVAPERRHVSRQDLKDWISREFPADKPPFLFDEVERSTHTAINADAFKALQVEREALNAKLNQAEELSLEITAERDRLLDECEAFRSTVEKNLVWSEKNSLLTIIAGLCEYSAIKPHERGSASQIAKLTEEIGAAISDDTVRRWLREIPGALAARRK